MLPISIKFQAYIPKSLGKPLLDYFKRDSRFSLLSNREEFVRKLRAKDWKGFTWLPEPGGVMTNYYFATDNTDIHDHHSEHTTRLGLHLEIKPEKIGNYSLIDEMLMHRHHENWGGINSQHSGESHRVKAYIKRIPFYDDMPKASNKDIYIGVCDESIRTLRSKEKPLDVSFFNSKENSFSQGNNDITTIRLSGSAGYPFTPEFATPNIDFELRIKLHKNLSNKSINININGWHNDFPAYELIIGHRVIYKHNPSRFGHTGPNPFNLSQKRDFSATEWIRLDDW